MTAHGGKAEDACHVLAPSLPGFGFSDKPVETGWDVVRRDQTLTVAGGVLLGRPGVPGRHLQPTVPPPPGEQDRPALRRPVRDVGESGP